MPLYAIQAKRLLYLLKNKKAFKNHDLDYKMDSWSLEKNITTKAGPEQWHYLALSIWIARYYKDPDLEMSCKQLMTIDGRGRNHA